MQVKQHVIFQLLPFLRSQKNDTKSVIMSYKKRTISISFDDSDDIHDNENYITCSYNDEDNTFQQ